MIGREGPASSSRSSNGALMPGWRRTPVSRRTILCLNEGRSQQAQGLVLIPDQRRGTIDAVGSALQPGNGIASDPPNGAASS